MDDGSDKSGLDHERTSQRMERKSVTSNSWSDSGLGRAGVRGVVVEAALRGGAGAGRGARLELRLAAHACIPNELFWILGTAQCSCTESQSRAALYTLFPTPRTVEVYTGVDGLRYEKEKGAI